MHLAAIVAVLFAAGCLAQGPPFKNKGGSPDSSGIWISSDAGLGTVLAKPEGFVATYTDTDGTITTQIGGLQCQLSCQGTAWAFRLYKWKS